MQTISHVLPAGEWTGSPVDRVTLDFDARHRRRAVLACDSGRKILLDLVSATRLRSGDGLAIDEGVVEVQAAHEPLLELRAPSPDGCVRLAWHLGNRHVPAQVFADRIRIRADHVLAELAQRLGASVVAISAAFDPEPGAYEGRDPGHAHGHSHGSHAR